MDKPTKLIVDCSTREQTIVELTDEEISQLAVDRANAELQRAEQEAAEAAKAAAKNSARSKLAALGLDDDEVAAIIG
jgi:hypothetical protein